MTMTIYKSTDTSAPTLQGIVGGALSGSDWADGSLLQLFRKCLVTGYGTQPAAGWTQSFAGTSEGVFKMGAGTGFYLHVLDDGSMTAGAREANMYGSENQTALSTSTAKFPTVAQVTNGILMRKSDTADATQRQWILFADNKTFYLFVSTGSATAYYASMSFGDFTSYKTADAYNCMIIGRTTSAAVDALSNETADIIGAIGTPTAGHYIARGYNQAGTSVQIVKLGTLFSTSAAGTTAPGGGVTMLPFPNPVDDRFWLSRAYLMDGATSPINHVRGTLRGWWITQHGGPNTPFEYDFAGVGTLAGRTFRVLGLRTGTTSFGRYTMETSDTWD